MALLREKCFAHLDTDLEMEMPTLDLALSCACYQSDTHLWPTKIVADPRDCIGLFLTYNAARPDVDSSCSVDPASVSWMRTGAT